MADWWKDIILQFLLGGVIGVIVIYYLPLYALIAVGAGCFMYFALDVKYRIEKNRRVLKAKIDRIEKHLGIK